MGPPFSPHSAVHSNIPEGAMSHESSHDNGSLSGGSSASSQNPVTAIITTGPDGTAIDEASQQSTISNVSAGNMTIF